MIKGIRKKKRQNIFMSVLVSLSVVMMFFLIMYYTLYNTVNEKVYIEAGNTITADIFAKIYKENISFNEDASWIDNTVPGTYDVYVKSTIFVHRCELVIVDSISPEATLFEGDWFATQEITAENLVVEASDVSALSYELLTDIDLHNYTSQEYTVRIQDSGENYIDVTSNIRIVPLYETVQVEIGETIPDTTEFIAVEGVNLECITNMDGIDNFKLQNLEIVFLMNDEYYYTCLVIDDTTAPSAETLEISAYHTSVLEASEFVENIEDMTEVSVTFAEEIDMSISGEQSVAILLTDEGGNITLLESVVRLEADTEAPEIACEGGEIRNILGESIAYKQSISATDNCDETIEIEFDNSEVDINTAGEYNIYCTATDLAGNVSEETFTVVIYEQDSVEAEVYEMADKVLASLIDDTMSEYEIVEAIYWYCKWNISYVGYSDKSDWVIGAYNGLKYHSGDCFTYASVAKVLLTRAGITNMDISKIPAATEHYWNLVDIGDGWVHFDSCARSDGVVIFLWNNTELMEYSNSNNLSHNYDASIYPTIN